MENNSGNMDTMPVVDINSPNIGPNNQQLQPKMKRKHRRGKPKPKNAGKAFKNTNWKFQVPRLNYNRVPGTGGGGGGGGGLAPNSRQRSRAKLIRSNSLAPYNTNRFLMEEHMVEVPTLLTPTARTRDSSFSVDSEDNYFFSLPEDEEDFLTKEFSNVYEKARVERLENLTKQELIEECLQIEDRYSSDQGNQHQLNIQRISAEFMSRIRSLEQKIKELSRENYNLRCQLMRSTALAAAAASPPSATAPTAATSACQPAPMESSSEDTESDSSSSSSSSSSDSTSSSDNEQRLQRSRSSSRNGSVNEDDAYVENNAMAIDGDFGVEHNEVAQLRMPDDSNDTRASNSSLLVPEVICRPEIQGEIDNNSEDINREQEVGD